MTDELYSDMIMTMSTKTKTLVLACTLALFVPVFAAAAANSSEVHVKQNGDISVTNISVIQKSGTALFARAQWESTFLRIVITTNASTDIKKNYGEKATVEEVEVGHLLDVEGTLSGGGDSVTIVAKKIRDTNLLREAKSFSGTIKSVDAASQSFVITDKSLGDVTVVVPPTVVITQGKRQVAFDACKKGVKVVSITGTYDYATKILTPSAIELFQSKEIFKPRTLQGTLKSVSGITLPAQLVVTADGTEYTVYLSAKTSVLSKNKAATTIKRFAEGDSVRLYGAVRETNLAEIDAEVVRDLNF
jgi:hypothetical protein